MSAQHTHTEYCAPHSSISPEDLRRVLVAHLGSLGDLEYFLVDGTMFALITRGNNACAPPGHIWIDKDTAINDIAPAMLRETTEYRLIQRGLPRNEASAMAAAVEQQFRRDYTGVQTNPFNDFFRWTMDNIPSEVIPLFV
jgi:hypothetical protein